MKAGALVLWTALLLSAAQPLEFDVTDARGKKASGVTIEAGAPDADGWSQLSLVKAKGDPVLVWPFNGEAKLPDGPEPITAIVIQRADAKALASHRVIAAIATPVVMGLSTVEESARKTGFDAASLNTAFSRLTSSPDAFEKGIGLLYANKPAEAIDDLARALKERQRRLTRVPSEIFPAAMVYGQALYLSNKFDDAAVVFLTALKQRPGDESARKFRADALIKAGKPEAAGP
jgi:hypothetical protein